GDPPQCPGRSSARARWGGAVGAGARGEIAQGRSLRGHPTADGALPSRRTRLGAGPASAPRQRRLLPLIASRARLVITVSEFSRRELQALLGVDAKVVPGGVDPR